LRSLTSLAKPQGFCKAPDKGLPGLAAMEIGNQEDEVSGKSNITVENLEQSDTFKLYHLIYEKWSWSIGIQTGRFDFSTEVFASEDIRLK
jgi:hypothetical protein